MVNPTSDSVPSPWEEESLPLVGKKLLGGTRTVRDETRSPGPQDQRTQDVARMALRTAENVGAQRSPGPSKSDFLDERKKACVNLFQEILSFICTLRKEDLDLFSRSFLSDDDFYRGCAEICSQIDQAKDTVVATTTTVEMGDQMTKFLLEIKSKGNMPKLEKILKAEKFKVIASFINELEMAVRALRP